MLLIDAGDVRWELPPRARRIRHGVQHAYRAKGTTSACAENTRLGLPTPSHIGNYLRVRGEYLSRGVEQLANEELPPRARRIRGTTCF